LNINAIVLAGRKKDGILEKEFDVPTKALIPFNGKPMISYVIDAIKGTPNIGKIIAIGPENALSPLFSSDDRIEILDDRGGILENIEAGITYLKPKEEDFILIITSDIPLVTSEMINYFINVSLKYDADFFYPILKKEICEEKFPNTRRTYGTVKEGTFTGGNFFLVRAYAFMEAKEFLKKAINYRKKPWKLSKLLGFKLLVRFFTKKITISEVENKAYELLGYKGKAIEMPYPEIGIDVDKESDYILVREKLKHKRN